MADTPRAERKMVLAFDTYYRGDRANTVCIRFEDWETEDDNHVYSEITRDVEDYVTGQFFKRELPCILSLISQIGLNPGDLIIVDGFVYLDDDNRFGLGAHLHAALGGRYPVIGVAKRHFATIRENEKEVYRGASGNPLFVTAVGIGLQEAARRIEEMHGTFRIPALLKRLDQLTREA